MVLACGLDKFGLTESDKPMLTALKCAVNFKASSFPAPSFPDHHEDKAIFSLSFTNKGHRGSRETDNFPETLTLYISSDQFKYRNSSMK